MNLRHGIAGTVVILAGVLGVGGDAHAVDAKFAYVDVARIFDNYEKTKDNDRTLQEKGRVKEEERDALVHEVRQLKDEMALLADDAKEKKQEELEAKVRDLQEFDNRAKQELGKQRRDIVQEIFKDIDDTVQRYGERKGLDMVLNERALLYRDKRFDITEEVLGDLNKEYARKKK